MTQAQIAAYLQRPKRASGEIVLTPSTPLAPPLDCVVCGQPILLPSTLASATTGFRHTTCDEDDLR